MRTNLYCMHDKVANEIQGGLFRANNHEVARRAFHEMLQNQQSPFASIAKDMQLLWIAVIDTEDAHLTSKNGDSLDHLAEVIADGEDWINANKEQNK